MAYLTQLNWQKNMGRFEPHEQKVLLALSKDGYRWRTRERIAEVTGLDAQVVDQALSDLISEDLVRPSFSKKNEIIFGLRERVG